MKKMKTIFITINILILFFIIDNTKAIKIKKFKTVKNHIKKVGIKNDK